MTRAGFEGEGKGTVDVDVVDASPTVVTLKGDGLNVTREITGGQVAAILEVIFGRAVSSRAPIRGDGPVAGSAEHDGEALAEFFRRVGAKRNPDKIVTIAEFMRKAEGKKSFTREEVAARFMEVGEPVPGNMKRDLRWAKSNGWIAPDPQSEGSYYVTGSGSKAVSAGFSEEITNATRIKSRRRRRGVRIEESGDSV